MEGENFESTSTSSVDTQSYEAPASTESYEGNYESDSEGSYESDGGYEGNYDESSGQSGEQTIASARSAEGTSFELYTDPVTGKTEFRVTSGEPEAQAEEGTPEEGFDDNYSEQDDYQREQQGLSQDVSRYVDNVNSAAAYTVDEFAQALANGNIDERRVPQEYQAQYAEFKIEQAKAAFNERVRYEQQMRDYQAQQEAALQEQLAVQNTPEARIAANEQFYSALETEAARFAMQDLGITEKDIEQASYDDDGGAAFAKKLGTAIDWHKNRLMGELQAQQQRERAYQIQQEQLYSEINEFTNQAQATEPHFAEIDDMMRTAWQEMPTKYGSVVKGALDSLARGTCTQQEALVIKKYFEDTRKLYYARANGLSNAGKPKQVRKKPPMVERSGNGRNVNSAPDYAALRNADARGKKAWLADFFKGIEL